LGTNWQACTAVKAIAKDKIILAITVTFPANGVHAFGKTIAEPTDLGADTQPKLDDDPNQRRAENKTRSL